MKLLIMIRGLPGSGKTTLANALVTKYLIEDKTVEHYEADQFMVDEQGNYAFDPNKLGRCHRKCMAGAEEAMENLTSVVIVSNTFTTEKEYIPYLDLAYEYGYETQIIDTFGQFGSVHDVPTATLTKMSDRWDAMTPHVARTLCRLL